METLLFFYMFFGALFALIISTGQFLQKKKEAVDYIYALSFAGLGIWLFQIGLYATGVYGDGLFLKMALLPVTLLVPPLMAVRYRWIIISRLEYRRAYALLFLPAFLAAGYVAFLGATGAAANYEGWHFTAMPVTGSEFAALSPDLKALYGLYVLPKLYLVLALSPVLIRMALLWKRNPGYRLSVLSKSGYVFAGLIVLSNIVAVAGDLFSVAVLRFAVAMANTSMLALYLTTQRHPDYNRLLKTETRKAQYENSKIRGLDIPRIMERLYEIMESEKAFADEDLSLADLARDLGISPHQLSEILNERIGKNFNTFVNEYRVAEARKLLVEEPGRSVLSVGVAVGFNSNTTFTTVFTRLTGLSPGNYRKARMAGE